MSATIVSHNTVDTMLFHDGQADGAISEADARQGFDSMAGLFVSTVSGMTYTFGAGDYGQMIEATSGSALPA